MATRKTRGQAFKEGAVQDRTMTLEQAKQIARGLAKRGNALGWPVSVGKIHDSAGWFWAVRFQQVSAPEQIDGGRHFEPVAAYKSRSVARANPVGTMRQGRQEAEAMMRQTSDRIAPSISGLLAALRALVDLETALHWQTRSDYADHLLFERLYQGSEKDVDPLAERAVAMFGNGAVDPMKQADLSRAALSIYLHEPDRDLAQIAFRAESVFANMLELTRQEIGDRLTPGVDNLLGAIADRHESHLYLLGQRTFARSGR
jgi:DNA-binding ferritin-like protein